MGSLCPLNELRGVDDIAYPSRQGTLTRGSKHSCESFVWGLFFAMHLLDTSVSSETSRLLPSWVTAVEEISSVSTLYFTVSLSWLAVEECALFTPRKFKNFDSNKLATSISSFSLAEMLDSV